MGHTCQICNSSNLKKVATLKTSKKYKGSRYKCVVCGFEETIFGKWDFDSSGSIKQINKIYKEQEENNG